MLRFHPVQRGAGKPGAAKGLAARVFGTLFFGLFFAMGCFFAVLVAREAWHDLETRRWTERQATITRAEVAVGRGENAYTPTVEFQYDWNGARRTSRQLTLRDPAVGSYGEAAARIGRYPVGATTTAFVAADGRAVLEHGSPFFAFFILIPAVFVVVGAVGIVATWRRTRRDAHGAPIEDPISSSVKSRGGARAMMIFGVIFAGVGAALVWPTALGPALSIWQARTWPVERCTVERSEVLAHDSDDGTTYSVDILYRYERGGQVHRSNRYSFFGGSSSGRQGKREIVRAHPVGGTVPCYVDPHDPAQAVLDRGYGLTALVALVPVTFLAIGISLVVRARRQRDRRQRAADALQRIGASDAPAPDDPVLEWLPDFELVPGPVALEPEWSRVGKLFALVFACAFWNGIVAVFAHQALESFERGSPSWGLTLFLVPFVLVGLGLVVAILHGVLGLTNARPVLHANARALALGDRLEVGWRLSGRVSKLRRLTLTLEGQEAATYQKGTDTHTATETFARHPVFDLRDVHAMTRGQTTVALPTDTQHSFEGGHNAIRWSLHLVGEIERWPDIDMRFPLVLLPLPERRFAKPEDHR